MSRKSPLRSPYLQVNLSMTALVVGIFMYSGIFSVGGDRYPIPSLYEKATGQPSPGSGLSRSFSEIVRGRFESSLQYNPYGLRIFSFFVIQLLLRITTSIIILRNPSRQVILAYTDGIVSTILFFWCFYPFLAFWKWMVPVIQMQPAVYQIMNLMNL